MLIAPIPGNVTGCIEGFLYGHILVTLHSTVNLTTGSWVAFMPARLLGLPPAEKTVASSVIRNPYQRKKFKCRKQNT